MNNPQPHTKELLEELHYLRERVAQLENSEVLLKKARETLQEEAIRRRMLVEQSTDGIVVLTNDGKVWEANQKYADMLGYTFEETQQLSIWDWEKSFPREEVVRMIETVDEKGDHFETRHTRKDGSQYDVEISTNGSMCGGQKLIFCVCRDITERKDNEARLRESEVLLATFIDNFQGIAYQHSVENITDFTPQLFRGAIEPITGFTAEELQQQGGWNPIVHKDDLPALQHFRTTLPVTSETMTEIMYRITDKEGATRWIREHARLVTLENHQMIHGTIYDITAHKQTEEANIQLEEQMRHTQKIEAIGTLAGGVAHDFNNILGIIIGYTDLVAADLPADSKAGDKLARVKKASLRAREIIRQLLTFSRKVGPKKQPLNLSMIINETVSFLDSTLPSSITLTVDIPKDKMMVLADPTQMHQVIMNLCVNASQALASHSGTITLSVSRTADAPLSFKTSDLHHTFIQVIISDTGSGIPSEILDRIFEPYFTTRETGKGSGMGLAVVHGIIENHGGEITVTSAEGKGTVFIITLPEYTKETVVNVAPSEKPLSGTESVLFIDDEEEITTIARLMLESQGFKVTTHVNPMEAMDLFTKDPQAFDIVITDMAMPGLSGVQVYEKIHAIRSDIPVILCTGHSTSINEERAKALGIAAFILKPLYKTELTRLVRDIIDKAPPP